MGWCGGRLFEAARLLTFSTFRVGAYFRWALIPGWALKRINTVYGKLSNSQNEVIITLTEKKVKDKRHLSTWRLISLINVDIKIGSKAITKRFI